MPMTELSRRLRAVKEREGFTWERIARAIGVHEVTAVRWATQGTPPRGFLVRASIARFLKRHEPGNGTRRAVEARAGRT